MSVIFQAEKMARLLSELLGRNVTATIGPIPATTALPALTASYAGDKGDLVAVCRCDLEAVLNGGAALCMIPSYEAANNLKAKRLDPVLLENFTEILNVCAQLFGGPGAQRVTLASVCPTTDRVPEKHENFIKQSRLRREVQLSITGYGNGKISVFC